ncbi:M48 family metallopeptidase [Kitasatospora viridis]|uniref:Zn-dependent protease with chaperone function n=1 Tax=Kitasatospora viridis TaxID=281105 RepID=A0A561SDA3_9ACTN|nr:M48 family metallopeptidase [Kitasatospora viridis]TWF72856.1 Zn-dependent protease with chaperone function [Kitasatospora viridis]
MRTRALAGLIVLSAWYVVSLLTVGALLWFDLLCLRFIGVLVNSGLAYWVVFYAMPASLGVAVLLVGKVVRSVLPLAPVREGSLPVDRAQAAALWHMVDELVERIGARPPSEIRLLVDVSAAIVERTALLGLLGGRRVLYIGAPLMITLDADEFRAVVAHELAHDAARHTRFSALTVRVSHALDTTVREARADLRTKGLLRMYQWIALAPLLVFAAIYRDTVLPARREHEFAADDMAAEVVGTEVMVRALRGYHAANRSWHDFTVRLLRPNLAAGVVPDDPFAAFAHIVAQPHYRERLHAFRAGPLPFLGSGGLNPHPSPREREERLLRGRRSGAPSGAAPAPKPLDGAAELAALIARTPWARTDALPGSDHSRITPWPQWLSSVGEFTSVGEADRLLRAAARLTPSEQQWNGLTLHSVLVCVATRSHQLVQEYGRLSGRRSSAREGERRLAEAAAALVQRWLVVGGLASWRVDWGAAVTADCPALGQDELGALVHDALSREPDAADSTELHRRLEAMGLDLEAVTRPLRPFPVEEARRTSREKRTPREVRSARAVMVVGTASLVIASFTHL